MRHRVECAYGILFYGLLFGAFLVFSPGLSGDFLFDDHQNLKGLTELSRTPHAEGFAHFVLSGISSSLGRPLSLATFAPQHYLWPDRPGAFLYINLMLHLLTGTVLFWALLKLSRLLKSDKFTTPVALAASAIWLIHPLQVSTVLYVIQRMAELSALFTFAGLLAYIHGRTLSLRGSRSAYLWMSLGVGLGTTLGVLSKENGILLPLYILILEFTLLRPVPRDRNWNRWALVFIGLPLLALCFYLAARFDNFLLAYSNRDFSLTERLFTECRILFDYLAKLFIPHPSAFGLLFDDYPISRNLVEPILTLPAIAGVVCLFFIAFFTAKKHAVLSFSILWYFAAHLLESTFIPLELYFEHRNYVAIAGPLFAAAYYSRRLTSVMKTTSVRVFVSAALLTLAMTVVAVTSQRAALWGHPLLLAATWAEEKPDSIRAQLLYASRLWQRRRVEDAIDVFRDISKKWPNEATAPLTLAEMGCYYTNVNQPDADIVISRLKTANVASSRLRAVNMLDRIVAAQEDGVCASLPPSTSRTFISTALENPLFRKERHNLLLLSARTSYLLGERELAVKHLEQAYRMRPQVRTAIELAIRHTELKRPSIGLAFLNDAKRNTRIHFITKWRHRADFRRLEKSIKKLEKNAAKNTD